MKLAAGVLGGRGGGKAELAQGGADSLNNIAAAFEEVRRHVAEKLGAS